MNTSDTSLPVDIRRHVWTVVVLQLSLSSSRLISDSVCLQRNLMGLWTGTFWLEDSLETCLLGLSPARILHPFWSPKSSSLNRPLDVRQVVTLSPRRLWLSRTRALHRPETEPLLNQNQYLSPLSTWTGTSTVCYRDGSSPSGPADPGPVFVQTSQKPS